MKGFFSKFKGFVNKLEEEISTKAANSNVDIDEIMQGNFRSIRKGSKFGTAKMSRSEIVMDQVEESLEKLFEVAENKIPEPKDMKETNFEMYFKEPKKSMTEIFFDKFKNNEQTDIASDETLKLLTSTLNSSSFPDHNSIVSISLIGFHHKKGTEIEMTYPDWKEQGLGDALAAYLENDLLVAGMPDAIHNAPDDFVYFVVEVSRDKIKNITDEAFEKLTGDPKANHALLYGISCFKQIMVTEAMRKTHPELTRSHVQKAVCVLSRAPIFGMLLSRLIPVTKVYFLQESFDDTQILKTFYDTFNALMKNTKINSGELLNGTAIKKLVIFLKERVMVLWKALFLEKRILIYSKTPSACSTFIHTIISLFPNLCNFKFDSEALHLSENHYREYGLPLRFLHDKCVFVPYFSVQNLDAIFAVPAFLGGTSNTLIKTLQKVNWDLYVDIDTNSVVYKNDAIKKALAPTKQDKDFINAIIKKVKANISKEELSWYTMDTSNMFNSMDTSFEGSEDWTRLEFYKYLRTFLTEVEFFIHSSSEKKLASLVQEYNKWIDKEEEERFIKDDTLKPDEDPELETKKKSRWTPTKSKQPQQQSEESKGEKDEDQPEDSKLSKLDQEQLVEIQKLRNKGANTFSSKKELMAVLKLELKTFKQSNQTLKKFGAEWINEWIKTRNFYFWLKDHHKMIGDRSCNNPHASNHFYYAENGNIYFGDLSFGKKQGKGQYVDRNSKTVYRGQWEEDEMSGEGSLASLQSSEFLYDGHFKNNRLEGEGKWIRGKQKYVGRFHNDTFEGSGVFVDSYGNIYEGEFQKGMKCGMGKIQYENGDSYIGAFEKDDFHGQGQYKSKNGTMYSGSYVNGLKSGFGSIIYNDGDSYEGEWKENKYEGQGILKKSGVTFEGKFADGKFADDQIGVIKYSDNTIYEGMISNQKPHGTGILTKNMADPPIVIKGKFENGELIEEVVLEEIINEPEMLDTPEKERKKSDNEEETGELDLDEPDIVRKKSKEERSEKQEKPEKIEVFPESEKSEQITSPEKKEPEETKEESSA